MHFETSDIIGRTLQQEPIGERFLYMFGIYTDNSGWIWWRWANIPWIFGGLKDDSCQNSTTVGRKWSDTVIKVGRKKEKTQFRYHNFITSIMRMVSIQCTGTQPYDWIKLQSILVLIAYCRIVFVLLFLRINVTEKNFWHMGNWTHDRGTNCLAHRSRTPYHYTKFLSLKTKFISA